MNEPQRTFLSLLNGEIECLHIAIAVGATNATRTTPDLGVWLLNCERLSKIIAPMIMDKPEERLTSKDSPDRVHQGRFAGKTASEVAVIFDETGIENRFFRLHPEVARWIDETEPLQEIILDYLIL